MEYTVTIEKIIAGGKGLARQDTGKVIMLGKYSTLKEHPGYIGTYSLSWPCLKKIDIHPGSHYL
jgi:hypothetical protein